MRARGIIASITPARAGASGGADALHGATCRRPVAQLDAFQLAAAAAGARNAAAAHRARRPAPPATRRPPPAGRIPPRRPARRPAAAGSCRNGGSWTSARPRRRPSAACRAASRALPSRRAGGSVASALHQAPPLLAERHRRVRRHLAPAGPVQFGEQPRGRQHRVAGACGTELQRLDQVGRELPQCPPAVGGAEQRILVGKVRQVCDLAAHAQQPRPSRPSRRRPRRHRGRSPGPQRAPSMVPWNRRISRLTSPALATIAPARGVARPGEQAADQLSAMSSTASVRRASRSMTVATRIARRRRAA